MSEIRTFGRPRVTMFALEHHRPMSEYLCAYPVYRPCGQLLKGFTDCSRGAERKLRLASGQERMYCTQHHKMAERIVALGKQGAE
jgi:hypothetical protein